MTGLELRGLGDVYSARETRNPIVRSGPSGATGKTPRGKFRKRNPARLYFTCIYKIIRKEGESNRRVYANIMVAVAIFFPDQILENHACPL